MKNRYNVIYVVCTPGFKTGGTELLHQLVYQLRAQGAKAELVYATDRLEETGVIEAFRQYVQDALPLSGIQDEPGNLVILPELYPGYVARFKQAKTAIWWLSVDNFPYYGEGLYGWYKTHKLLRGCLGWVKRFILRQPEDTDRKFIYQADLHYCQSYYAIDYLKKVGIKKDVYYLSDYINDIYIENGEVSRNTEKQDIVLYNPRKGWEFTDKIRKAFPDLQWVALQNMTTQQVQETMSRAKVYIDFGNHPGKDRFPREAAISGCCIITGKSGAAAFAEDVTIPEKYKFDNKDKVIPQIGACIAHLIDNYPQAYQEYRGYLEKIEQEKARFASDIQALFFDTL